MLSVAPIITAPPNVNVYENAPYAFTGVVNAIRVKDPSGTAEQLTLTVSHGTLALGTTTGLTVTDNGTASLTASGPLASIDVALATLTYTPSSGYSGPDTLDISDKDTDDNLTGTNSVAITVTDPVTQFPLPTADGTPNGIAAGSDGNIWFTDSFTNANNVTIRAIDNITPAGTIANPILVGTPGGVTQAITSGPGGILWFTYSTGPSITAPASGGIGSYTPGSNSYITNIQ